MIYERTIEAEIGAYISSVLRTHFGKGPASVFVTLKPPFITIHLRNLISPMEKILLKQGGWNRVLEIRELIIEELKFEVIRELWDLAGINITSFFAWPSHIDRCAVERKVESSSEMAQKKPS